MPGCRGVGRQRCMVVWSCRENPVCRPPASVAYDVFEQVCLYCRDRALVGSLFWRWDVQVYAGSGVADYGVRRFDSTFGEHRFPRSTHLCTRVVHKLDIAAGKPCQSEACPTHGQFSALRWPRRFHISPCPRKMVVASMLRRDMTNCHQAWPSNFLCAGIIAEHASKVRRRENARPPRQECRAGCWVKRKSSLFRRG